MSSMDGETGDGKRGELAHQTDYRPNKGPYDGVKRCYDYYKEKQDCSQDHQDAD